MSVDIGESLLQSWLRHVKRCDVVQTNWKAAIHLGINNDKADDLLSKIRADFPFFAKKQKPLQIIRQLEIDALGCIVKNKEYYACDIAFHTDGLHYSGGDETVPSKMLRTVLCLYSFLEAETATIIFATPRFVSDRDKKKLEDFINELNNCLENKWSLKNYTAKLYSDYTFETGVLNPVMYLVDDINDTSEVFVRGCQLISAARAESQKHIPTLSSETVKASVGTIDLSELSKQDIIEQFVIPILSETCTSRLKPYFDTDKSKKMFGGGYAFLSNTKIYTTVKSRKQCRNYAESYYLKKTDQNVYVSNDTNRQKLIEWVNANIKK